MLTFVGVTAVLREQCCLKCPRKVGALCAVKIMACLQALPGQLEAEHLLQLALLPALHHLEPLCFQVICRAAGSIEACRHTCSLLLMVQPN